MILGPPTWATGSWVDDSWADGTWATSVSVGFGIDDLTTCVAFHLRTLLPGDQTTDYRAYLNAVRGLESEFDDLNTAQWLNLNF